MSTKKLLASLGVSLAALTLTAAPALGTDGSSRSSGADCQVNRNSDNLRVVGLTADQKLVCFRENDPGRVRWSAAVNGLIGDAKLVGIDFRPANGVLYGLADQGGVYTLDVVSAKATLVSRLNVALSGSSFGVDFNPVVDRLRIVSDNGQNLRANVDDGTTTADAALNYVGPPPVSPATGVVGAGYTNNDADPNTATTLFDIDAALDQVVIQAPPNSGTLNATGKLTVDTQPTVGFDIYSTLRDGTTVDVRGLASLTTGNGSALYRINLLTGRARQVGHLASPMVGLAIPLQRA